VAKDVKAQVEFNPARIAAWRQLGYEKRALAARDFADDRKDAGEIGAGHLVTMLYELVPAGQATAGGGEGLRYQTDAPPAATAAAPGHADELMTVKLRFKEPMGEVSRLIQGVVTEALVRRTPSEDQAFAAAVAACALGLRGAGEPGFDLGAIRALAASGRGRDPQGYRQEFIALLDRLAAIQGWNTPRE
jgi:Ca-activated chloride channel family protein